MVLDRGLRRGGNQGKNIGRQAGKRCLEPAAVIAVEGASWSPDLGDADRTGTCFDDGIIVAPERQPIGGIELLKAGPGQAHQAAAVRTQPEVALGIFGNCADPAVRKSVGFGVHTKVRNTRPFDESAAGSDPAAPIGGEPDEADIWVRQTVSPSKGEIDHFAVRLWALSQTRQTMARTKPDPALTVTDDAVNEVVGKAMLGVEPCPLSAGVPPVQSGGSAHPQTATIQIEGVYEVCLGNTGRRRKGHPFHVLPCEPV